MKINEGLLYGYGLFETIKVINNEPIYLLEHFDRMKNSSKELDINLYIDFEEFQEKIRKEINKFPNENFALRVSVLKDNNMSSMIFSIREINYTQKMYKDGFKLTFSDILKNETSKIVYHKTLNYLENLRELKRVKENGYNEVIFLNTKGQIGECSTSNIFVVKNKKIYTPKLESGILNGIIRQKIIDSLKKLGVEVYEENMDKEFLLTGDEIFITNSLMGIMPISKINNLNYKMQFTNELKKSLTF